MSGYEGSQLEYYLRPPPGRAPPPEYVPPDSLYPTVPYIQERVEDQRAEDQPLDNSSVQGYLDQITNLLSLLHDRVRSNEEKVTSMHSTLQQIQTLVQNPN